MLGDTDTRCGWAGALGTVLGTLLMLGAELVEALTSALLGSLLGGHAWDTAYGDELTAGATLGACAWVALGLRSGRYNTRRTDAR
jgi:hypothetical protein